MDRRRHLERVASSLGVDAGVLARLAAAHRLLRPREGARFRLIGLCAAGRDRGSFAMQLGALREHLDWHIGVISRELASVDLEVRVTDLSDGVHRSALDERLLQPLDAAWPAVRVRFEDDRQAGRAYYTAACFGVDAVHPDGGRSKLSDGGFVDWTAQLLADAEGAPAHQRSRDRPPRGHPTRVMRAVSAASDDGRLLERRERASSCLTGSITRPPRS